MKIHNLKGIYQILTQWIDHVVALRSHLLRRFEEFNGVPSAELVDEFSRCARCRELANQQQDDQENEDYDEEENYLSFARFRSLTARIPFQRDINPKFRCRHCRFEEQMNVYDELLYDQLHTSRGEKTGRITLPSASLSLLYMLRKMCPSLFPSKEEKGTFIHISYVINEVLFTIQHENSYEMIQSFPHL